MSLSVTYSDGLRGKVALADHDVSCVIQFDDGPGVGLDFSFKGLMFLQLTLSGRGMMYSERTIDPDVNTVGLF